MSSTRRAHARLSALVHPCAVSGMIIGACLIGVVVAWLLVANRVPSLAQFAFQRNWIAGGLIALLMLLPLFLFLGSPVRIFFSGVIGWTILALAYQVMEIRFGRLETRMGAFHLFMLGAIVFGLLAVLD
jgi:hypothetical protein